MGRKPVGKRAMTPAERQARRRKRLRKERSVEVRRRDRLMRREKNALAHIPMPPGITYWRYVTVLTDEGEREVWAPTTRPLATCGTDLEDEDVQSLIRQLRRIARQRGLPVETEGEVVDETHASLLQARDVDHAKVGKGGSASIGRVRVRGGGLVRLAEELEETA